MESKAHVAEKPISESESAGTVAEWPRLAAMICGAYVLLGGFISFLGYPLDMPRLTDWIGEGISIQPNTTIAVMATGATLLFIGFGYRRVPVFLSALVALIGATSIFQMATRIDLGFNTILLFDRQWGSTGVIIPGLMGTPGSTSWTLLGTSMLLLAIFTKAEQKNDHTQARVGAVTLALIAMCVSSLSLIGYLYGAEALYTIPQVTVIALQTAIFIFVAAVAVILLIGESGPMRLFADQGPAGIITRQIVPATILLPIVIGAIRLAGENAGFYDTAFGSASRSLFEIVFLLAILWWTGSAISKQVNEAKESEVRLQQLANAMPQVVWISDESGKIHYYNDRVVNFGGITKLDESLFDWQPGIHPEDLESTIKAWNAAVVHAQVYEHEHRILMADGTYRWHLSRAVPWVNEGGKTSRWYGTATDIHDQKLVEVTLRESEQRFSRFMQHLPGLSWIKDAYGKYIYANEAAQKAFQKPMPQLYGMSDEELFPPATAASFVENDQRALDSAVGMQTVETLRSDDGVLRFSLVSKFPIPAGNGSRPMIGGMAIDITEQKLAEANREFLFKITEMIRTARDANGLLGDIADSLGQYLELHRCLFNEIDLESDIEVVHRDFAREGDSVAGKHRISDYSSIASAQMRAGLTIINRDSKNDPRTAQYFDKTYGPSKELSYVAVPMMRGGQWVASLWCSDNKPRNWTDTEVALVENIAERVWVAVERLRNEIALRESEEDLRKALEYAEATLRTSPVPLLVLDPDLKVVSANEAFYLKFKVNESKTEGLRIFDLGNGQWNIPELRDLLERVLPKQAWFESFEVTHEFENIGPRSMLLSGRRMEVLEGGPERIIMVLEDITDRKRAEDVMARLAAIVSSSDDAIVSKDLNSIITSWNRGAENIFGYTADEIIGKPITILMPSDRVDEEKKILTRIRKGESIDHYETVRQRKDGTLIDISLTVSPIYDAEGAIIGASKVARDITARKQSELQLRESEERSKLAQESGGVGIWDWDAATGNTYWSETMWSLYGEDAEEKMPGDEYWQEHIHPDDRTRVRSHIDATLSSSNDDYRDEFRIITADGKQRWIESIATIVRDEVGRPTRMYGVNLDLTEKKLVEDRIRASETQLRLVTNTIPALVSYIDRDERYQFVNRKYNEWFGKPANEFIGKKMKDALGARAYQTIKPHLDEAFAGNEVSFDGWVDYKAAGQRFVHVSYVPDVGLNGDVLGIYALVNDLSDLRRASELLQSSQERMRLLTESFTDYAIISTDTEGRIESWNPGAQTIFGYDADEIIGESSEVLFTPEDVSRGYPVKEMRVARKTGKATDERWHVRKDGSRFYASGVMVPLFVGDVLSGYAKIATDLTERKRNAEALQRAHDEMEMRVLERTRELAETNAALIAEINERQAAEEQKIDLLKRLVTTQEDERRRIARDLHDQLGQRLTALRLKIESLREVVGENKELQARTTRLQEIAELLDSEVSFLAWELRPSAIEELGLIDAIGTFVREWARHNSVEAEFHATGMANFDLDPEADTHLYRIAQEALNNIGKHAAATKVNVLVERMGDEVVLIVEDNGKGFDRSEKRVGNSSKGLGLTGMGERASLIAGTLEIESAPGAGTTIFARIPIVRSKKN